MKTRFFFIICIFLLFTFYFFYFKPAFYASDDLSYATESKSLLSGTFIPDSTMYSHRLGLILPLALVNKLFGFNHNISVLFITIIGFLQILILFLFLQKYFNISIAAISSSLLAINIYFCQFSLALLPDTIITFLCLLILIILFYFNSNELINYPVTIGFIFSSLFFWGILTKLIILLLVPFLIYQFIVIRHKTGVKKFYSSVAFFFILFFCIYSIYYFNTTGSVTSRIKSIEKQHNQGYKGSYVNKHFKDLAIRLTYGPPLLLISHPAFSFFSILYLVYLTPYIKKDPKIRFVNRYFIFMYLSHVYFSTSLTFYNPLNLFYRHLLILLIPLSIISGYVLFQCVNNKSQFKSDNNKSLSIISILFAMLSVFEIFRNFRSVAIYYFVFSIFFLSFRFIKSYRYILIFLLITINLGTLFYSFKRNKLGADMYQRSEFSVFNHIMTKLPKKITILTDQKTISVFKYFHHFKKFKNLKLTTPETFKKGYYIPPIYTYINTHRNRKTKQNFKLYYHLNSKLIMEINGIKLYESTNN